MSSTARRKRNILPIVLGLSILVIAGFAYAFWPSIVVLADPRRNGANSIPSENMAPTLMPGDYVTRVAIDPAKIRRGMVVVFRMRDESRVARVVGLPGDRIKLRGGVVYINGQPVLPKLLGTGPALSDNLPTRVLGERFPGEAGSHRILDHGLRSGDDFAAIVIPSGRLFVLGDNRDDSADSRFSAELYGAGLVAFDQLVGELKGIYWATDHSRIGKPIDP